MIVAYLPGGLPLYAFSVLLALGVTAGLMWMTWQSERRQIASQMRAAFWTLLGALVGARVVFVVAGWSYFRIHLLDALLVSQGGVSWAGALAGALLALGIYASATHNSFGRLADGLLPLATPLVVAIWLGCWLDGYAYGPRLDAWWAVPARDEWGLLAPRWPTQLLGALLALGVSWLLELARPLTSLGPISFRRSGWRAALGLLGFSLQILTISLLQADPGIFWHGVRLDSWVALAFVGLAIAGLLAIFLPAWRKEVQVKEGAPAPQEG